MGSRSNEPLMPYEEVQRLIDERLEAILLQESSEPVQSSAPKSDRGDVKCKLKSIWKRIKIIK